MRVVRILLLVVAVLMLAGCGGGGGGTATVPDLVGPNTDPDGPPPAKGIDDPAPAKALSQFVADSIAKDYRAMWEGLTAATQGRVGPTLEAFRASVGADIAAQVGSFTPGKYEVVTSARTSPTAGLASIAGQRIDPDSKKAEFETFGAALRKEDGEWRLELFGPAALTLVVPLETVAERHVSIAVDVEAGAPVLEVGVWVDGKQYSSPTEGPDPTSMTIFAEPEGELEPGEHTLVAYVDVGDSATATSWTFLVKE